MSDYVRKSNMTTRKDVMKCDNCFFDRHLETYPNPYDESKDIILCQKCAETPFGDFKNKTMLKRWWEKKKPVKSFTCPTHSPKGTENFKLDEIHHEMLDDILESTYHSCYHAT